MAKDSILFLGGTGTAGVCLLRELTFRNKKTVIYARSPAKIPADLTSNPLIKVIKGEMQDTETLSTALFECHTVIPLLGPTSSTKLSAGTEDATTRRAPHLRHGHRSIYQPEDNWSFARWLLAWMIRITYNKAWLSIIGIQKFFEEDREATHDIDWTVYRIGFIHGSGDETKTWAQEREDGKAFAGPVGASGWGIFQKRAGLTRWLADAAETGARELIGKMPAVSKLN